MYDNTLSNIDNLRNLVDQALARINRPYSEDITLHVFQEIRRDNNLLLFYNDIIDAYNGNRGIVNRFIPKIIINITGRHSDESESAIIVTGELNKTYTKLYN